MISSAMLFYLFESVYYSSSSGSVSLLSLIKKDTLFNLLYEFYRAFSINKDPLISHISKFIDKVYLGRFYSFHPPQSSKSSQNLWDFP